MMIKNHKLYPKEISSLVAEIPDELFCDVEIDMNGNAASLKAVKLTDLISLLNKIAETSTIYGTDSYSGELIGKDHYVFTWSRENNNSTDHLVTLRSNGAELFSTKIPTILFHGSKESFYLRLIRELLDAGLFDLARKYGEAFFNDYTDTEFKFQIGDKVTTIPGAHVHTEREGFVIDRLYHDKEKSNMYYLMIDGKKYKKRYFEKDLVRRA